MERPHEPVVVEGGVESAGALAGVVVHRENRVQVVVVRVDAREVTVDERLRGDAPVLDGGVDVGDGRLERVERVGGW